MQRIVIRVVAVACLLASAQANAKKPWAVIDGDGAGNVDGDRYDVVIIAVDGNSDFDAPMLKRVEPGFHYVQLASTRQNGVIGNSYQPYAFMAEPCVRYVMYAQYENTGDRSPWHLVVGKSDKPVAGCKAGPAPAATPAAPNAGQAH